VVFPPRQPKSPAKPGAPRDDDDEPGSRMQDPVALGLVKVKCCGLCGMEFMEANLPGVVSFQAIAKLRKQWNAPLPEDSAKLRSDSSKYSSVKLCAFCYQFFYDSP